MNAAHNTLNDEVRELASLYALGALPSPEAKEFAEHLSVCAVCEGEVKAFEELTDGLADAFAATPPPDLKERLLAETTKAGTSQKPQIDFIVRGEESDWTPVPHATGVYRRVLFVHPSGDETLLVRMDPGGKYPAHPHIGVEQMYILSGELIFDDHTLYAGDFEAATAGHLHAAATTTSGCMVLVMHRPLTLAGARV